MADAQFDWADPLLLEPQLTAEERMVRDQARRFADEQLVPRVRDDFRHERFDRSVVRGMGELGFFGATLPEGEGGAGLSNVAYGLIARELERVDFGLSLAAQRAELAGDASDPCLRHAGAARQISA